MSAWPAFCWQSDKKVKLVSSCRRREEIEINKQESSLEAEETEEDERLLLSLFFLSTGKVAELVGGLVGGDDAEEVADLLLLEVLLCQILKIKLLKRHVKYELLPGQEP